jgi:hypothetical protein
MNFQASGMFAPKSFLYQQFFGVKNVKKLLKDYEEISEIFRNKTGVTIVVIKNKANWGIVR